MYQTTNILSMSFLVILQSCAMMYSHTKVMYLVGLENDAWYPLLYMCMHVCLHIYVCALV